MSSRKIFAFFLALSNVAGLIYLLCLACLYMLAQDDHAYLMNFHKYGFNSSFLYWYQNWQGRFGPHYLLNIMFILRGLHVPLLFYYIFILALLTFGTYQLIKNTFIYFNIPVNENLRLLSNAAGFIVVVSIYVNFEFNTFYWLNASCMYYGGLAFFVYGLSQVLSNNRTPLSFLLVAVSFLYVGSSTENFSFVSIVLVCIMLMSMAWANRHLPFNLLLKNVHVQKAVLAVIICGIAFLIMVSAPGNKVRMHTINLLFAGYKVVPVPFAQLPSAIADNYKILLVLIMAKLPFIIGALPIYAVVGALSRTVVTKAFFKNSVLAVVGFIVLLMIFIMPTVYATAGLGPLRSLTFIIPLISTLTFFMAFSAGNIYTRYRNFLVIISIVALVFWTSAFIHDIGQQVPGLQKYDATEKSRLNNLASLKAQNTTGVVVLDSLYTPHFKSYSNVLRNEIMDKFKRLHLVETTYYPIQFDPLFYDEITADTTDYTNKDLRNDLELPFSVRLKK